MPWRSDSYTRDDETPTFITLNILAMSAAAVDSEILWLEPDPASLSCLVCKGHFLDRPLVRTFLVVPHEDDFQHDNLRYSRLVHVQNLHKDILLFDRHLECLIESKTIYHAVSHVWDPQISLAQQAGRADLADLESELSKKARQDALEHPIRLFQGAQENQTAKAELWHDYISVPQWTTVLKDRILGVIHDIFASARTTIIYYDDVSPESIQKLYHGRISKDVLQGLMDVCNARWFSRVWTAMEFVRSGNVQMMLRDYTLCSEQSKDPIFMNQLRAAWRQESRNSGGQLSLERQLHLGRGKTLVPWNLGMLISTKTKPLKKNFGLAFSLLSRRGCREERDFLYAMRGLLATSQGPPAEAFDDDFETEYYRLAGASVAAGDYSPLLMTPTVPFVRDPRTTKGHTLHIGFNDVFTWGMGLQWSPPDFIGDISLPKDYGPRTVNLRLQTMGIVSTVHKLNKPYSNKRLGQLEAFGECAHIAAQCTGPDVARFVTTLKSRLYGVSRDKIARGLEDWEHTETIQKLLNDRYASPGANAWQGTGLHGAKWLADTLGMTEPHQIYTGGPSCLDYCSGHGGTMHGGGTVLNCLIGLTCLTCHEMEVFRVASFVELSELRHARAYRMPGLMYDFVLRNGVGLLEKDGRVVGRMVWATASCECKETRMVKLRMPGLPPRRTPAS